jgi:hypothetical protein
MPHLSHTQENSPQVKKEGKERSPHSKREVHTFLGIGALKENAPPPKRGHTSSLRSPHSQDNYLLTQLICHTTPLNLPSTVTNNQ